MRDKTGRKVKTFELKTFEGENKTVKKSNRKVGIYKNSGIKTLNNFLVKNLCL